MIENNTQAKLKKILCKNEQGSTLVENAVSVLILMIFSLLILTTFLAGLSLFSKHFQEYARVKDTFGVIECLEDIEAPSDDTEGVQPTSGDSILQQKDGTISFAYGAGDEKIEIEGTYFYDKEGKKIGEFTVE